LILEFIRAAENAEKNRASHVADKKATCHGSLAMAIPATPTGDGDN